jgi:hypothetical protein
VLGLLTTLGVNRHDRDDNWARIPTLAIVAFLSVTQMATDLAATARWRLYVRDFEGRLETSRGLVDWQGGRVTDGTWRDRNWALMTVGWVHPIMSIILSKNGNVQSILDYPRENSFRPIDLSDPNALPKLRGVSYQAYFQFSDSEQTFRATH